MIQVKVNDILEDRERSIAWLATKCNITYSTMYNFCNSKTSAVSYILLESVCNVLDCSIEDILEIKKTNVDN